MGDAPAQNGWWSCSTCGALVPLGQIHVCHPVWSPIQPSVSTNPLPPAATGSSSSLRARLILDFQEGNGRTHVAEEGWAKIDGPWVLWRSDEEPDRGWQSWPIQHVICIDWLAPKEDP